MNLWTQISKRNTFFPVAEKNMSTRVHLWVHKNCSRGSFQGLNNPEMNTFLGLNPQVYSFLGPAFQESVFFSEKVKKKLTTQNFTRKILQYPFRRFISNKCTYIPFKSLSKSSKQCIYFDSWLISETCICGSVTPAFQG